MSKLLCLCGHVIVDQTNSLPYKADFFADEDDEAWFGGMVDLCSQTIRTREAGRELMVGGTPFSEIYGRNADVSVYVNDMLSMFSERFRRQMYECPVCGRLWVQSRPEKNEYASFWPETSMRGILRAKGVNTPDGDEEGQQ